MVGLWLLGFGGSQYVTITIDFGCRIVFVVFFASGFGFVFLLSFPVPFALYLQQF
jgi:hypothetical protein